MNDTAKVDYAVLEGFHEGFRENFRKAFDTKYSIAYITHLETKHVVMDTLVIKCLKAEALKDWDADKHISSFAIRLTREQ